MEPMSLREGWPVQLELSRGTRDHVIRREFFWIDSLSDLETYFNGDNAWELDRIHDDLFLNIYFRTYEQAREPIDSLLYRAPAFELVYTPNRGFNLPSNSQDDRKYFVIRNLAHQEDMHRGTFLDLFEFFEMLEELLPQNLVQYGQRIAVQSCDRMFHNRRAYFTLEREVGTEEWLLI